MTSCAVPTPIIMSGGRAENAGQENGNKKAGRFFHGSIFSNLNFLSLKLIGNRDRDGRHDDDPHGDGRHDDDPHRSSGLL